MIVVSDTSAITALLKIRRIHLLSSIYGEVSIPEAVHDELAQEHSQLPSFIRVVAIADFAFFERLSMELDRGESEAIVLAKELGANQLLIDENRGRQVAQREGLHVIGVMGVGLEAKGRGLIPSLRQFTEQLESEARFRVAARVKELMFRAAGEL